MKVSVVVPTFRRLDILKKCINSVENMDIKAFEIFVVCRPKDDQDTYEWLLEASKANSRVNVITVNVPGQVQAMNAAIPMAKGEVIAILDDDALPKKDWLTEILACYEDSNVGAVGGRDIVHSQGKACESPQVKVAGVRNFWGHIVGNHHLVVGQARKVDVIKGCNLTFRKSAVGKLKFDDRLLGKGAQVGNDSWFSLCVKKMGYTVILNPKAIVDHYPAERSDGARDFLSKEKCFEHTANCTAFTIAHLNLFGKMKYFVFCFFIGNRFCPGVVYFGSAILKRPRDIPSIMIGGWRGFFKGLKASKDFNRNPPFFS